jgi:hypothetical protein
LKRKVGCSEEHLGRNEQFGWGALGAAAPYLVRALHAVQLSSPIPQLGVAYLGVSVCAILVGGLWSMAMKSDREWKAMYNGATFPIVFAFLIEATR